MAKVDILTFHYANNYGAVLQAYGLARTLQALGHQVQVLDYRPLAARRVYFGRWPRRPMSIVRTAAHRWKFHHFRQSHLPLSRTYLSMADLEHDPPKADCVVCGSDQVWNVASYRGFDPTFFLAFLGDTGPRRVSYAATFGSAKDLGAHQQRICELLSQFGHLSVRDINSQRMIHDLVGLPAVHVLDPSFLADYNPITPPPMVAPPYALMYHFGTTALSVQAAHLLQRRLGIPVISVGSASDGARALDPSPTQWLSLVRHADFVCTNSFHGVCFSLINRKQFVVLPLEGEMARLDDLLQTTGLHDRVSRDAGGLEGVLSAPIDYPRVSARLDQARERSIAYLRNALE